MIVGVGLDTNQDVVKAAINQIPGMLILVRIRCRATQAPKPASKSLLEMQKNRNASYQRLPDDRAHHYRLESRQARPSSPPFPGRNVMIQC